MSHAPPTPIYSFVLFSMHSKPSWKQGFGLHFPQRRICYPRDYIYKQGEKAVDANLSILLELSRLLLFLHCINELLDSLVPCLYIGARPPRDQVGRLDLFIHTMDFVGDIHSVGFWVIFSGIGAGDIEGDLQRRPWRQLHLRHYSGPGQCGHKHIDVIVLPRGRGHTAVLRVAEVLGRVAGLAAELVVAGDGAVARQDFHPTEHGLVAVALVL